MGAAPIEGRRGENQIFPGKGGKPGLIPNTEGTKAIKKTCSGEAREEQGKPFFLDYVAAGKK